MVTLSQTAYMVTISLSDHRSPAGRLELLFLITYNTSKEGLFLFKKSGEWKLINTFKLPYTIMQRR